MLWHDEAALWVTARTILRRHQNPRKDGYGRHLAELAQGRKQDHLKQTNSLMALSLGFARRRPAQKGSQHQAIGCSRGWANDKDHRVGGRARQFGSVSAAAGASA